MCSRVTRAVAIAAAAFASIAAGGASPEVPAVIAAPQAPPPLPTPDLARYPDEARDQIAAALAAVTAEPSSADAVGRLALTLHAWEEFEAAAAAYARAQALAPSAIDWWYFGGMLATRRGLHAEAARQYGRARDLAPDNALVALRYADAALDAGDIDAARSVYEPLTTHPEAAPAAWYGMGRVRQSAGDIGGAREAFEQAVALFPDFGGAHYALAQLQRRAGDREGARLSLQRQQQCLTCWPVPPDPWRARLDEVRTDAAALLQRGVSTAGTAAGAGGDAAAAEAIRLHEAALERNPGFGQAHVNLISLYARTGNVARAEQHYRAAAADPGHAAEAHRTWGWVLLQQQRAEEALPVLTEAVALAPTNAQALTGLGLAFELLRRPADAVRVYTDAVAAAPAERDIRFGLARALIQAGRIEEAIARLETLREPVDAQTPRYLYALSAAYVRHGNLEAGVRVGEEAATLATRFGQADLARTITRDLAALRARKPR